MKSALILLFIALNFVPFSSNSQTGINCGNAIIITPSTICNFQNFTTTGTEYWLKFVASSPNVSISLNTVKYGIDAPHIHAMELLSGSCSSLNSLAEDELPYFFDADKLRIDLDASNLTIGQIYFLKIKRENVIHECGKGNCRANSSSDPTTFSICIENINVIIPPDFGGEEPLVSAALESNRGQLIDESGNYRADIKLYNDKSNPGVFIGEDKLSLVFHKHDEIADYSQRIDMKFDGGASTAKVFKTEQVPGLTNYYLPHIPEGITGNKAYSRAVLNKIYNKIDFQYYSNKDGMKFYFILEPGSNSDDLILNFDGPDSLSLGANGELIIHSALGSLKFEMPHCYQVNPAGNVVPMPWQGEYVKLSSNKIKFSLHNYSKVATLFIQMDQGHRPPAPKNIDNLLWSTYYGGEREEHFYDIDADQSGNVYFTGYNVNLDFPSLTQTIYSSPSPYDDARIIVGSHKPLGERRWSTVYGAQSDAGYSIAADMLGNVYVTGVSGVLGGEPNEFIDYNQLGAYNLAPSPSIVSSIYAVLLKFNQNNGVRTWATLFGEHTAGADFRGNTVTTDNAGNVIIAGRGKRINLPFVSPAGSYQQNTTNIQVGFIAKFNSANALTWFTMFGNNGTEVMDVNVNNSDKIYITGITTGTNTTLFPMAFTTAADYQHIYAGGATDAFFARFNSINGLEWSTFYGGSGDDVANGIDFSELTNEMVIVGKTTSSNTTFPLVQLTDPLVHYNSTQSNQEGFVTIFRGQILKYSSFYGGLLTDECKKARFSSHGNLYIVGSTQSSTFPLYQLTGGYYQDILENDITSVHGDGFLIGLNSNLQLEWSSLFGGERFVGPDNTSNSSSSDDIATGLAIFNDEILYIGGDTKSEVDFPITVDLVASPNAFIQYDNSGAQFDFPSFYQDGFLSQFSLTNTILNVSDNEIEINHFELYPNPNCGNFNFHVSEAGNCKAEINIFNVLGQCVYHKQSYLVNGTSSITLTNISNGLYVIKVDDGTKVYEKKFLIK
jgi:hypothetical protein